MAQSSASYDAPEEQYRSTRFGGRFDLLEELDTGQTGVTFRAADSAYSESLRSLTVKLSLRIFPLDSFADEELRQFGTEFAAASKLAHRTSVRVFDLAITENELGITFENWNGVTLSRRLERKGMRSFQRVHILHQIASALEYLHSAGIFLGGLNPSEIILDSRGEIKVMPLPSLHSLRSDGAPASASDDIRSFGAIAHALARGNSSKPLATIHKAAERFLSVLTKDRKTEELHRIIRKALEQRGTEPYSNISHLAADLASLVAMYSDRTAAVIADPIVVELQEESHHSAQPAGYATLFLCLFGALLVSELLILRVFGVLFASFLR